MRSERSGYRVTKDNVISRSRQWYDSLPLLEDARTCEIHSVFERFQGLLECMKMGREALGGNLRGRCWPVHCIRLGSPMLDMVVGVETVDLNAQVAVVTDEKGDFPKHILLRF